MDNKNSRKKDLDDFWDISELVPARKTEFGHPRSVDAVLVTDDGGARTRSDNSESTVIKRYIPPHSGNSELSIQSDLYEKEIYYPTNSLIHKVRIFKYKTAYNHYGTFLRNAVEYMDICGSPCEYTPFFSYVPQYDQMNDEQRAYYFWFRENARNGAFIKTDCGYLFLYIFELLNLGDRLDVKKTQYTLMSLWNEYNSVFPSVSARLADWICDYSLLHHLSPPVNLSSNIIKKVISLKEYYISIPKGDTKRCAQTLMRYCSSYDHRASKFYTEQNKELFDRHILGALTVAVGYYSADGNILSGLDFDDSTVTRDVYAGAVCSSKEKYRIEVSYCSFSRSNELRFLVGDIIRYSENKLRAYIGVKSKMAVYSITIELRRLLDEYFAVSLPPKRQQKKAVERQEYDALYDVPKKPFSLSDAVKIEAGSWETTRELVSAFEEDELPRGDEPISEPEPESADKADVSSEIPLTVESDSFGRYRKAIIALINGSSSAISDLSRELGKMPDAVVDEINEIAYEVFGDLLIEDDGMGNYSVIEDYTDHFNNNGE